MPTLHASERTDPGMLPQSQALESTAAANPGAGTKRVVDDRRVTGRIAGAQHGRGLRWCDDPAHRGAGQVHQR